MPNFSVAPDWQWLVTAYLFTGGIAGGLFTMGTVLRVMGQPEDRPASRIAFFATLPLIVLCPILLTFHLGNPERFWHMLVNTSEGTPTFVKFWSPMPVGAWALLIFGGCSFLIFLNQLITVPRLVTATAGAGGGGNGAGPGSRHGFMPNWLENTVLAVGFGSGVFIMGYTGVLLSASNQPVWSDAWALGGLFVASALATGTSFLVILLWLLKANGVKERLGESLFYFLVLELILFAVVDFSLGNSSSHLRGSVGVAHYISLGLDILAAVLLLAVVFRSRISTIKPSQRLWLLLAASVLVIVSGFLLRTSIVFAPAS